jgi:hypothetical protein
VLEANEGNPLDVATIAVGARTDDLEAVFKICKRLSYNNMCFISGTNFSEPRKARFVWNSHV